MSKVRITTANIKNPNYTENHQLFVGTHTGSFKKIDVFAENPHKQINLQSIAALNKDSRITSLTWGCDDDGIRSEILIGRANKFVKVYDVAANQFTSNIEMDSGPVVGLARYDGQLIAACGNGTVQILKDRSAILHTGDHLSIMRQCPFDRKLIATGGKGLPNCLKVYDLETEKRLFKSKNLPNDHLQLEVPVWDTDVSFIDVNRLVTCSRYGYLRMYDRRSQRRPIVECATGKAGASAVGAPLTYCCLATHGNVLYVGAATGIVQAYDYRKPRSPVHTYKGFTGSLSTVGIDETGRYLYTSCLDRFVRVHDAESAHLQYQCYVKSKATRILLSTATSLADDCVLLGEEEADDGQQEMVVNEGPTVNVANKNGDAELDEIFDRMPKVGDVQPERKRKSSLNKSDKKKKK